MRVLVFSASLDGHYVEYLAHIHKEICTAMQEVEFMFLTPPQLLSAGGLEWDRLPNVKFAFMGEQESAALHNTSPIKRSFLIRRTLAGAIKKFGVDVVYVQNLMELLPFALMFLPAKVKVVGILYKIYLYAWKDESAVRRLADVLKYMLISRSRSVKTAFVLNDPVSARILNRLYHTDRFQGLVDPYVALQGRKEDIRPSLGIGPDDHVFLHFGVLSARKGTMEVLQSMQLLTEEERKKYVFVFAGKIADDIKDPFHAMLPLLHHVRIVLKEGFVDYAELPSLIGSADVLVLPYSETCQSSGIIGYASAYGVPVIAPGKGMIGKLVRRFRLGVTIPDTIPATLAGSYAEAIDYPRPGSMYCTTHNVESFAETIRASLV